MAPPPVDLFPVVPVVALDQDRWRLPGLATAHSHAFQRALRGRTQRRSSAADSFWSWRALMYRLVEQLDPDALYTISRFAYTELAMSGVTAVGEFHYLHHAPHGHPYTNRTELADAVIQAALDVGIRLALLRTAYLRGGYQQSLSAAQQRFADPTVTDVIRDLETLRARYANQPLVTIGVAAHSVRAVPLPQLIELAHYARAQQFPFHMHICEQRREVDECLAEYGTTPVALLAQQGLLSPHFVGIHATHLTPAEIQILGAARCTICLCRTTERDLGDGLPPTSALVAAGVQLCVGVDSHACGDAFEEIRAVELDERSRLERRHIVADASTLLAMGSQIGYSACGLAAYAAADQIWLRADDPALAAIDPEHAVDAILFAAGPRAVDRVDVAGRTIVEDGRHLHYDAALHDYQATLRRLSL
ncbi:MAG: formimidoylglutamate deiminase [Caldilineaceae bacterium]